jgi:CBS-domain-containing membrane protein
MSLFGKKEWAPGNGGAAPAPRSGYGIDQAIALMRTLPVEENAELVVRVMHQTLESLNVHLPGIIDDAQAKEVSLQERMEKLDAEIESFAEQIDLRRHEIARLAAELKETSTVKERLLLAEKLGRDVTTVSALPMPPPPRTKSPPELRAVAAK